jgi:hypothetical protein
MGIKVTTRAESVNKFFEVTVPIRTEIDIGVVDKVPYAVLGHPRHVGGFFTLTRIV